MQNGGSKHGMAVKPVPRGAPHVHAPYMAYVWLARAGLSSDQRSEPLEPMALLNQSRRRWCTAHTPLLHVPTAALRRVDCHCTTLHPQPLRKKRRINTNVARHARSANPYTGINGALPACVRAISPPARTGGGDVKRQGGDLLDFVCSLTRSERPHEGALDVRVAKRNSN